MRSKSAVEIFSYWNALRGNNEVPSRDQIEPAHIRTLLADLLILEHRADDEIRFRLAGTRICALFGRELRGSRFDALWAGEQSAKVERLLKDILAQKLPVSLSAVALAGRSDRLPTEVVLLPLRSSEGHVNRILGAIVPLTRPLWLDATPANYLDLTGIRVLDVTKAAPFLQSRPEITLPPIPPRSDQLGLGDALRRVLHLRVFEGGRAK
ncbi:PAS domain-containing protein [Pararhizobium arenae]|uniref:PAS domain-containing protein n=1 Tax=Pararhizobium arenae TaxID=1856850 RepID=UPI00094B4BE5|nr:PAS domain-containing protein [Pararhizobium arenae]